MTPGIQAIIVICNHRPFIDIRTIEQSPQSFFLSRYEFCVWEEVPLAASFVTAPQLLDQGAREYKRQAGKGRRYDGLVQNYRNQN